MAFDYATLLGVLAIIGGYYIVSTFVFPDDPQHWPELDYYYARTNRTVIAGMMAINLATVLYALAAFWGMPLAHLPLTRSWISIGAAILFIPGLGALWFVKSKRANLVFLILTNATLLVGAIGPKVSGA